MYRLSYWVLLISFFSGLRAQNLSKVPVQKSEQIVPFVYKSPSYDNMREKMKRDFPSEFRFFDNYAFDNAQLNESITNYLKYTRREHAKNISAASVGFVLGIPSLFFLSLGVNSLLYYYFSDMNAYTDRRRRTVLAWAYGYLFVGTVLTSTTAAIVLPLHFSVRKDRKKALHFSMEMARMLP